MTDSPRENREEIEITDVDGVGNGSPPMASDAQGLSCDQCQAAIPRGEEIRTENAVFCPGCFEEIKRVLQDSLADQSQNINYLGAVAGGLLGGLLAALVWWGFVTVTNIQFGLVAVIIGWAAGKGVMILSGYKRALSLQLIAVGLTVLSYGMATYWVSRTFIHQYFAENDMVGSLPLFPDPTLFLDVVTSGFEFFDVIFLAIALWQAWKMPAPVVLNTGN